MYNREEKVMTLKLLVDKKRNRVVFAESGNDFIDVLLSFLTLPMGTIVRLVGNQSQRELGSMHTLYHGLESLEVPHFQWDRHKEWLLHPSNSAEYLCRKLQVNIDDTEPAEYYMCESCCSSGKAMLSMYSCYFCGSNKHCKFMDKKMYLIAESMASFEVLFQKGVFVKETSTFMVTDDMKVIPMSSAACMEHLNKVGIEDVNSLEEMSVDAGRVEVLSLLRLLFISATPLTDLFLSKNFKRTSIFENKGQALLQEIHNSLVKNREKMTVKIFQKKSDRKVLYAEAQGDFVSFLSQLVIPLGTVVKLIPQSSSLQYIHNLYKSVEELHVDLHMKSVFLMNKLLSPKLGPHFSYEIHPLGIKYFYPQNSCVFQCVDTEEMSTIDIIEGSPFPELAGKDGFVPREISFMVTDDLVVTPLSPISGISIFQKLNVPISDIEERVVYFGKQEALKLLEASLNSKSALTDAFSLSMNLKKPKLEK